MGSCFPLIIRYVFAGRVIRVRLNTIRTTGIYVFNVYFQKDRDATAIRGALTFFGGILLNLGFRYFDYSGAGALSCLTSGITASTVWRARGVFSSDPVSLPAEEAISFIHR